MSFDSFASRSSPPEWRRTALADLSEFRHQPWISIFNVSAILIALKMRYVSNDRHATRVTPSSVPINPGANATSPVLFLFPKLSEALWERLLFPKLRFTSTRRAATPAPLPAATRAPRNIASAPAMPPTPASQDSHAHSRSSGSWSSPVNRLGMEPLLPHLKLTAVLMSRVRLGQQIQEPAPLFRLDLRQQAIRGELLQIAITRA